MNIKKTIQKGIAIGAIALALLSPVSKVAAQARFVVDSRLVLQSEKEPVTQEFIQYDKNKFFVETGRDFQAYGLNLENNNARIGYSLRDNQTGKDPSKLFALAKWQGQHEGYLGGEFQSIKGNQFYRALGLAKATDELTVQATANTDLKGQNAWRASTFLETSSFEGRKAMLGVGGGQNADGGYELQLSHSALLTKRVSDQAYVRVGTDLLEARYRIGAGRTPYSIMGSFSQMDNYLNDLTKVFQVDSPITAGPFQYYSAESSCGNRFGDMGLDVRYTKLGPSEKAYAAGSINLGKIGPVKDIRFNPEVHHDLAKKVSGLRLGASIIMGNETDNLKLWHQTTFDQGCKPNYALYVGFSHAFGGKSK